MRIVVVSTQQLLGGELQATSGNGTMPPVIQSWENTMLTPITSRLPTWTFRADGIHEPP
jgi:hypothetical protein